MFGKKKNEFSFEDEVETSGNEAPQRGAHFSQPPAGRKASSSRTLLLLLLLLAVAGGGGYFVMMNEPEPPPAPQPVVQRQAIPIARPQAAPATTAEPATAATPAGEVAAAPAGPSPAAEAPAPAAQVAAAPTVPAEVPVSAAVAPTAPAEQAPVTAAVAVQPPPSVLPTAAPAREPAKEAAPAAGKFTLVSLPYADQGNVTTVQQGARKLGFQPTVTTVTRNASMTRLRYGTFRPEEAPARLQELKKVAPAAFTLRQGELVSVYAGSFAVQDKARVFADLLSQQQILVEEEVVQVKVPLQQVSFGSFAERSAADKAAARARAAGLVVTVQARR
jgi:hypothetical protein